MPVLIFLLMYCIDGLQLSLRHACTSLEEVYPVASSCLGILVLHCISQAMSSQYIHIVGILSSAPSIIPSLVSLVARYWLHEWDSGPFVFVNPFYSRLSNDPRSVFHIIHSEQYATHIHISVLQHGNCNPTSPQLPLELQFLILHHLGGLLSYYYHSHSWLSTLATCCLVCRTWFPVAQRYLLERVTLRSDKHLKQLVSRKSTSSDPIGLVKELEILSGVKYHQRPFHHLVPLYTTNRLLCLKRLAFWGSKGDGRKDVFLVSTQFRMHLSCLRHVTYMELANFHFQLFWDLQHFVITLPALSFLFMRVVTWPQFSNGLGGAPFLPFIVFTLRKIDYAMSSSSPKYPGSGLLLIYCPVWKIREQQNATPKTDILQSQSRMLLLLGNIYVNWNSPYF